MRTTDDDVCADSICQIPIIPLPTGVYEDSDASITMGQWHCHPKKLDYKHVLVCAGHIFVPSAL